MDHVKLSTTQYDEAAMMRAGEPAEVLWSRAFAKCGATESDGFIPDGMPERLCPTRTNARVTALVREGLWTRVDGGWLMDWSKQIAKSDLETRREAGAKRQQVFRERRANHTSVSDTSRNALLTRQEVEVEVDAAAAASPRAAAAAVEVALSGPIEVLRSKLDARKLTVRWDKLDTAQVDELEQLIDEHGDQVLIRSALAAYRPDNPPAFAQAWLSTWRSLPAAGRLSPVPDPCDGPGHTGTVAHCNQCASEQKAGHR